MDGCPALQNENPFLPGLVMEESSVARLGQEIRCARRGRISIGKAPQSAQIASRREDLAKYNRRKTRSLPCVAKHPHRPFPHPISTGVPIVLRHFDRWNG